MANIHELKPTEEQRLSMADQNFLSWVEMTSALPHAHIHAVFEGFKNKLVKYTKQTGQPVEDISVSEIIVMFMGHTNRIGNKFGRCCCMGITYNEVSEE